MVNNEALNTIIKNVLENQLCIAIEHLENYLFTFVQPQASAQLEELKADYQLMSDYWRRGFDDPQRDQLYEQLLRRMYVITVNAYIRYFINNSSYVKGVYSRCRASRQDWSVAALRRDMEAYVSDVAMLELEPEHTRQPRRKALNEQHQELIVNLFDYIWTSRLWTDGVADAFRDMLLSPTIDSIDQQTLVSAITLSLFNFFGINKFRILIDVYRQSTDEYVRQRALVGWVLSLSTEALVLYPEVRHIVEQTVDDERCLEELTELQMQLFYCLRAESDNRIIQSEIMPELMQSGNIRVTRNGIEEVDDDPMDDVLHPELSEQRMERLEATMRRMTDMQKQGSDVYFGGFSQMKRFPFFSTVANWFLPFYMEHPAIAGLLTGVRGQKFLLSLLKNGPFCDSDKYSFVLGYQMAVSRMPDNLLEMMDRGEAMLVGGEIDADDLHTPTFIRRSYLQSMYRFFRVFPQRGEFRNPFEITQVPRYLFFANSLFQQTRLEEKMGEVVSFFIKHKAYDAARQVLQNYREERRDAQFYMFNGTVLMRTHAERNAGLDATTCFARLLELEPNNERGWAGYARALFADGDYQGALDYYHRLSSHHPERQNYLLNEAVCLTRLQDYEGALKLLYKLNYEAPEDLDVMRVLAWTLVGVSKYDQATRFYEQLLATETPAADDFLNYGYCLWFARSVQQAADMFRRYAEQEGVSFDARREFATETDVISQHGVSNVEVQLMIDLLTNG
jgi:tetratricopeptide (TPR) repeat protein